MLNRSTGTRNSSDVNDGQHHTGYTLNFTYYSGIVLTWFVTQETAVQLQHIFYNFLRKSIWYA